MTKFSLFESQVILLQELLLEEAGLDIAMLRRLSRWGNLAPVIGAKINPELERWHKRQQAPKLSLARLSKQALSTSGGSSLSPSSSSSSGSQRWAQRI